MANTRIPTYNRSVALEVTQQPSGEQAASMLISSFQNFSSAVAGVSQHLSKEEAQSQQQVIKSNISTAYKQFALQSLQIPDQNKGLENFVKSSQEYSKQLLQQSDPYNHEYIRNLTDYYHNEHIVGIEKNAIMQNKRIAQVSAYEQMDKANIDMVTAIQSAQPLVGEDGVDHTYDAAMAQMAQSIKGVRQQALLTNVDPLHIANAEKNIRKLFTQEVYLKEYQNAVNENRGDEYLRNMQDPNVSMVNFEGKPLSIEEKTAVIGKMVKIRNQKLAANRGALTTLNKDISSEANRLSKEGGLPNEDLTARARAAGESYVNVLNEKRDMANAAYQARQAALYMTPAEIKDYTDRLKPAPDDKDYQRKMRIHDYAVKSIQQQDNEFRNNPMQQVMEDPSLQQQVNDFEQAYNVNATGNPNQLYTPFNSTVEKPWQNIINLQTKRGLKLNSNGKNSVRLLDPTRVSQIITDLDNSNGAQKVALINKLNDEFGGGLPFNLVMKQLTANGMKAGLSMLRNIDPNSLDAMDVGNAFSMPNNILEGELKKVNPDAPKDIAALSARHTMLKTDATPSYQSFLDSTSPDYETMSALGNTVSHLASYYAATGKEGNVANAVARAENVIANRYNYMDLNNHQIRLPKTYPEKAIQDYAKKTTGMVDSFKWYIAPHVNREDAMDLIKNGYWRNDNVDHGLVWVDVNGRMWADDNGQPLAFSFDEAAQPNVPRQDVPRKVKPLTQESEQFIETGINPAVEEAWQKRITDMRHRRENLSLIDKLKQETQGQ